MLTALPASPDTLVPLAKVTKQSALVVEIVKQYPGPIQVTRRVKSKAPGKHFPQLSTTEQKADYDATAVEFRERYSFSRHAKAWGAAHTGPGIRFICESDAVDDPNHKGFWTTLLLWNRWRHDTYKDNREAEKQYFDEIAKIRKSGRAKRSQRPRRARPSSRFTSPYAYLRRQREARRHDVTMLLVRLQEARLRARCAQAHQAGWHGDRPALRPFGVLPA